MKKYIKLSAGEKLLPDDEMLDSLGEWFQLGASHFAAGHVKEIEIGRFRRPVSLSGDVQFLMAVSILVPIIVNCDGKSQDEIEVDAGCLAVQKILSEPTRHIHLENIDWQACKVDEMQPELKNPGKYRYLEAGERTNEGDEFSTRNDGWVPITTPGGIVEEIAAKNKWIRRPITEPQYRSFKKGDVIEEGDQFRFSEKSEWTNLTAPFLKLIDHSIIDNPDFRKLIK